MDKSSRGFKILQEGIQQSDHANKNKFTNYGEENLFNENEILVSKFSNNNYCKKDLQSLPFQEISNDINFINNVENVEPLVPVSNFTILAAAEPVSHATQDTIFTSQKNVIIIEDYLITKNTDTFLNQDSNEVSETNLCNNEDDITVNNYYVASECEIETYTDEESMKEDIEVPQSVRSRSLNETSDPDYETVTEVDIGKHVENRNTRKIARNRGDSYTTKSGKIVKQRKLRPLEACRMKCRERLEEEDRISIFNDYWNFGSRDKRAGFVTSLIDVKTKNVERKKDSGKTHKNRTWTYMYKFNIKGKKIEVCKKCFLQTLGENAKFIEVVVNSKIMSTSGALNTDGRGRHPPVNKTDENKLVVVREHIASFPAYVSHYTRKHTNKKYLGSGLNLTIMYDLYCQLTSKPVSKPIYAREFKKTGLKFKKPQLDSCTICDTLTTRIKNSATTEKATYEMELKSHQDLADSAYEAKKRDIANSKENNQRVVCTFDLQQVLPTPKLTSGNMFYKRQLSTYNLTIHNCTNGNSSHFMWNETIGKRGAIEISSCLYKFMNNLPPYVSHLILYSDTCGGQNRNSIVISMMTYLMRDHPSLQILEHKFLVPGHTHMECDCDHALIERKAKTSAMKIQHPRDWYQLVRTAGKKNKFEVITMEQKDFLDFASLTSRKAPLQKTKNDCDGNKFEYRKLRWLKFEKEFGIVYYKTSCDEEAQFKSINLKKAGQPAFTLMPAYKDILPISSAKKENLLSILNQLDDDVHDYYKNLPTKVMRDEDPDLDCLGSDVEDS